MDANLIIWYPTPWKDGSSIEAQFGNTKLQSWPKYTLVKGWVLWFPELGHMGLTVRTSSKKKPDLLLY